MTAPVVYKSSDASAPTLTGQVGSLVALLDACLVNGYGSKAAAGWTKAFSATNKGSYLGTAGHYLDVDDSGAGTGGAQEATVRAYEAMTAVATGTNPFPTVAQAASPGFFIRKSVTADATARGWVVFADGTTFYLFILSGDTGGRYQSFSFGRFYSFKTSDTYRSIIIGHTATGNSASGMDGTTTFISAVNAAASGTYVPRITAGTGTSVNAPIHTFMNQWCGSSNLTVYAGPNAQDGNIYVSRVFVGDGSAAGGLRGYLRGLYQLITAFGLNDGDTFTGAAGTDFAGRTFVVLKQISANPGGVIAFETTAWDTSS